MQIEITKERDIEMALGMELRAMREQKGYHQKEIVDYFNNTFDEDMTQARLSTYETGKRTGSIETLLKIAHIIDAKLSYELLLRYYQSMWQMVSSWDHSSNDEPITINPLTTHSGEYSHPLVNYLESEDMGVDICKDPEADLSISITTRKGLHSTYTKREFELLNRSLRHYIEFQIYEKSNK